MSNALRTALDYVAQAQDRRAADIEAVDAAGMWAPRRAYEAGRIGTDINANLIDEAALRAGGRAQEADALARRTQALQQRQALYAPDIARVEEIGTKHGLLRDGLSWFGSQVGQGVASMQDPVALAAAGTALGRVPGPIGKIAPVAGAAGAFMLNQRQMAGEHYGELRDDPTAMAKLGAQGAYQQANLVGAAGGALDTLLPGLAGRALGGAALRQGARMIPGSVGAKTLGGMALEGATEVGQGEISRAAQGWANPGRDTSGDFSDRLNEFAGGAAGGAPFSAAGAMADAGYSRVGRGAELVKEKTGQVVDLAKEKAPQVYEDSGIKGVVDLGMQGGKSVLDNLGKVGKAAQDYMRDASGKINYAEGLKRARADVERFKLSQEEADLLTEAPPAEADPDTLRGWTEQNYAARTNYVFGKLEALERDGVQEATGLLDALESDDPVARTQAVDEATSFLLERNIAAQVHERATLFQAAIGEFIQKGAARMTRGAKAAGDAAAFAGLNVAEGVKQGLEGKKNMQGAGFSTLDYDTWKAWRDQNALPLGEDSQRAHSIQRAAELRTRIKEINGLVPRPVDPEAAKRSYERATLFGEMLAAEAAAARRTRAIGHRVDETDGVVDYTNYVRSLAYEIEDMASSWAGRAGAGTRPTGTDTRQASVALGLVDSMAEDLNNVLGPAAGDVVARMAQSAEPTAKAFFDVLQERVANRQATMAERKVQDQTLQDQMLALLPQEHQATLREDGGAGARSLQQTVQMIARGRVPPAKRREIEKAIGADTLNRMLSLYGETVAPVAPETQVGTVVDDTGTAPARAPLESDEAMGDDAETSAWEARMKEKTSERGAGEKRYGVSFSPAMRTDPFEPLKKLSKEELAAFRDEDRQRAAAGEARIYPDVDRPRLFTKGQTNHDGSDAMMKRAEAMAKKLGPEFAISPWRAEGAQPAVEPRSAKSVMDDMGMPTSKRLAIYRDYMNSAAVDDKLTAEQRKAAAKHARAAQLALLDAVENPEAWGRQNRNTAELTEEQSATMKTPPGDVERLISQMLERRSKAVQAELDTYGADLDNKVYGELDSPEPKKANSARLNAGERRAVYAAMDRYFSERFLVVAERKIDREYSKIDSVELRDMIQRGRKAYDSIKDDENEVARSNLLWFKSPLADERTGKSGYVPIRANNLVAWVRKQRALGEEFDSEKSYRNRDKNEAFLDDLSEGISIVMNSGHVDSEMPYMLDKAGRKKSLQKDYPDNLELETSTYSGYKFGRQQQVAKLDGNPDGPRWKGANITGPRDPRSVESATDDEKYQKKVAFEQQTADLEDGGGNDAPAIRADQSNEGTLDPYTDIAVKAGLRTKAVPPKQARTGKRAEQHKIAAAAARRGGKSSDDAEAANIKNTRIDSNKLDRDLLRESGLESDKIRDDAQTTAEKEEVSQRSKNIADGVGPEPKVTAKRLAEDRAGALLEVFRKEGTDAGLSALERRMRTAKETNTNPRDGVVGGAHYAWPLAHVLNPETIGGMDLGTAEAARVVAMRAELAGLVLNSPSLDLADKVAMAKAMAPKASRDRITAVNVLKVLSKASETQPAAPEVAATGAPKSRPKPDGVRKLSLMSTQVHNDLQRPGFAATHDSPIRHEGKFNWREHTGKGEGNAAFGAGTYLSTGDGVHKFYKKMMSNKTEQLRDLVHSVIGTGPVTAEGKARALQEARNKVAEYKQALEEADYPPDVRDAGQSLETWSQIERQVSRAKIGVPFDMETKSPTYHVSVGIMKAQLMNWNKPLSEQSSYVRKRLEEFKPRGEGLEWEVDDAGGPNATSATGDFYYILTHHAGKHALILNSQRVGEYASEAEAKAAAAQMEAGGPIGMEIYQTLTRRLGSQAAASDYLQSLGILGHEYAAANGRNGTTPNYVIYDDSKITTNYVHFNKQEANNFENWKNGPHARAAQGMATDADLKAAREYFDRVLGKQVKAEFENITGYSGEFIEADNLIKVSTLTNAGVMNVARHEALHAFFSKFIKANPKAVKVLSSLTDNERVLRRLQTLLKDEPAALEQLVDGEERLAYIYQFAMAGQLRLPHTPGTTLMHKIRKFLRRVFQMVSDDERAVDLLYAFEHGKMSDPSAGARAMAKVLDQGTWMTKGARSIDAITQRAAAMVLPANTILAESISPTARALAKQFFTNPGEEGAAEDGKGYLNARNEGMRRYDNLFRKAIDKLDKRQLDELTEAMQNETPTGDVHDPDVAAAKEQLHALFERFHRYLTKEKGLRIGKINEGYFPVVYDVDKVREGGLEKLLSGKYIGEINKMAAAINDKRSRGNPDAEMVSSDEVISAIVNHITRDNPLDDAELEPQRQDGVLRPWFASGERRVLDFLSPEDRAQFQEKDIVKTVSRYVRQGVRTAEYSSRFGRTGALLDRQLDKIQMELEDASREMLAAGDLKNEKAREKWVKRQYRDVANAVGGMEGSLGHDISEGIRKINSWSIVYQNVRLLPLALFSSFVDPLGIVARGGEMREAFTTFTEGIKGVARQWTDAIREEPADRQKSQWEELAEHAGVIDTATFSHLLADEYGSVYLDGTTKKINEVMFKANGMEAWNRAMRVGATRSAVRFMERHNKAPTEHSARWMKDLGFEPGTLPLDSEGKLITDKRVMMSENPDMEMEEAEAKIAKVHSAINRWVEGAILSPNAAQRPAWGSDPHFSMFWHLKQFAYSFHETIMKRALNEAKHGNVMPLGVFAWYIPTMIAADVTKGLMLGAGELPAYMKGYDLGDWMLHGVERSGVLGIGQVAIDGAQDPTGLAGPAVEQITDIFVQPMEQNIVKALPVNALYSRAVL